MDIPTEIKMVSQRRFPVSAAAKRKKGNPQDIYRPALSSQDSE